MRVDLPPDLTRATALGGEMAARFAAFDWSSHPLGDPNGWSRRIRAVVALTLASKIPIVLWLGERLHIVYNDGYVPLLGDRHPGALGAAGAEVWWDIWSVVGPMLEGVRRTGEATWSDDLLLMLVTAGRPRERYFTFTYSPVIGEDGRVEAIFCAVTETTESVLGRRRLLALNEIGTAAIGATSAGEAVDVAVEACARHNEDLPFVAIYLDDEGSRQGALRGTTLRPAEAMHTIAPELAFWHPSAPAAHGELLVDLSATEFHALRRGMGDRFPEEALVLPLGRGNGSSIRGSIVIGLSPILSLDADYRGWCRLLADQVAASIANAHSHEQERVRSEKLAQLDRAKTEFLTNVSHEFRTPLTLMLGPLEDALRSAGDDEEMTQRLQMVERGAQRLHRLVNTLLDFARIETGSLVPDLVTVDVGSLTADIASSFSEVCHLAGLELTLDCPSIEAELDLDIWETVILNLVSNAFKFTTEGSITVTAAAKEPDEVSVTVADTGCGIDAGDREHIFERFYRSHAVEARTAEGTGIGLALVRNLVELLKGRISVESRRGVGTTVTVTVPAGNRWNPTTRSDSHPRSASLRSAPLYAIEAMQWVDSDALGAHDGKTAHPVERMSAQWGEGRSRALVVVADDNKEMRRYLQRILGSHWDTLGVENGVAAIEAVRRHNPDLLVTDVMMPGIDGFELLRMLRNDQSSATLPILMLSARAGIESASEALALGADDYLVKPFSSKDLVSRVGARLEGSQRERSIREQDDSEILRSLSLAELDAELNATTSLAEFLVALLASEQGGMNATTGSIGLLDASGEQIGFAHHGSSEEVLREHYGVVPLDEPLPMAETVRFRRRIVLPDLRLSRSMQLAHRLAPTAGALVSQPVRNSAGVVVGSLSLMWPHARQFEPAELDVVDHCADMLSLTLDRIESIERDHRVAADLQARLLDLDARSKTAVVTALYQPASDAMRVGGDWYTATTLGTDGRLGVSVGDIVGHGFEAAAVMSQLRNALGAASFTSDEPSEVMDLVERYADGVRGSESATLVYVIVDGAAKTVRYTCAGHPYPLMVTADGNSTYLRDGRRPLLGARPLTRSGASGCHPLPAGSTLILYTDGLIEHPGQGVDDGFERLADVAAECVRGPAGEACADILSKMSPAGGYRDDVVVMVVRPVGVTATTFVEIIEPRVSEVPGLRHKLGAWLCDLEAEGDVVNRVLQCVGEALNNAVEHGSAGTPGALVALEAFVHGGDLLVTVSDRGGWGGDDQDSEVQGQPHEERRRGLMIIHGLSEEVRKSSHAFGSSLSMEFRAIRASSQSA